MAKSDKDRVNDLLVRADNLLLEATDLDEVRREILLTFVKALKAVNRAEAP